MADYHDINESGNPVTQSYAGKTFSGTANFAGTTFSQEGGDFRGAVFEGFANFDRAVFEGRTVDFSNAVFLAGASFIDAQFGKYYQRFFGEWEICFSGDKNPYRLKIRKTGGSEKEWEHIEVPTELDFPKLLKDKKIEKYKNDAFLTQLNTNPEIVSLPDIPQILNGKEIEEYSGDIATAFKIFHANPDNALFEKCQFGGTNPREKNSRISFTKARFNPKENVNFIYSKFVGNNSVSFSSATYGNGGDVDFTSANFSNGGNVSFCSATFSNGGDVGFSSATFSNSRSVDFSSVTFSNGGDVGFSSATFSNGGYVAFYSATFSNDGDVAFYSATFSNKEELVLSQIVWINDGKLNLSIKEFREARPVLFYECLFLSAREISFWEARFPEKGSTLFQRCYFGRTPKVDFTGAFFRHASFEGGEILWLKKSPGQILKARLEEKYDALPDKTKIQLATGLTPVFEKGMEVLWKDLTTESAKNITLRGVNLSHSLFDGMTLTHIQLNAPEWLDKDGRKILYGEVKLKEDAEKENREISKFDLANIEDQYTQLKNNLEKQGNYLHAGYFHYGEQETRREIAKTEGHTFKYRLTGCYKWLSGYGEQPERAFKVALWMLSGFSLILALLSINTNPFVAFDELSTWRFIGKSFAKVFGAPVEILTPLSWKGSKSLIETFAETTGLKLWRIFFLVAFQFIMLAIQAPLLVLAVRRRFKR